MAGGGVVAGDDRLGVQHEQPEVVDAAAHAEAVPLLAVTPTGRVVGDLGSEDDHRPGTGVDAAAGAVAPGEPVAADGLVAADRGLEEDGGAAGDREAAAEAIAARGAARACAAAGRVVGEQALEDDE